MKNLLALIFLFLVLTANATTNRITGNIAITNAPSDGDTLTVNSDVRTWKNTVTIPATQIAITNVVGFAATNLFNQIGLNPYTGPLTRFYSATNAISLVGDSGAALVVTASGTWASITMSTQAVTLLIGVRVPVAGEPTDTVRTNVGSLLTKAINDYSTNRFDTNAPALANYVALNTAQSITGDKAFSGANVYSNSSQSFIGGNLSGASISNSPSINGTAGLITNGAYINPVFTNGQNYGQPFRSPGGGSGSEQFGVGAAASSDLAIAIGDATLASAVQATALGGESQALGVGATAVGESAAAISDGAIALGVLASAGGTNSIAIGLNAATLAAHTSSVAIGASSATTEAAQIMLGTSGYSVNVPGRLQVNGGLQVLGQITNSFLVGTNRLGGTLEFLRKNNTSLANGNNAAVDSSTNLYLKVSGPSGAFTVNGLTGGRDGRLLIIQNSTALVMTIANDSGVDPTAANRIYTGTSGDITVTNNPGFVGLIYDSATTHWCVESRSN